MADKEPSDELNDVKQMGMYRSCSRSRSGSRSRGRSGLRSHHRSRSPHGADLGRSRGISGGGRSSTRYDDYDSFRGSSSYREREARGGYSDYGRSLDPYARAAPFAPAPPHPGHLGSSSRGRSRSRSPMSNRRRHEGDRENPPMGSCIGIFGLSIYTKEQDLHDVFSRYGPINDVQIVYDAQSGRSRGFAFVYFRSMEDASMAKERCNGIEIDGRKIRVDFSLTQRAHTPTPGVYMGKTHAPPATRGTGYRGGRGGGHFNHGTGGYRNNYAPHTGHSRSRGYPPAAAPHHPIATLPPQDYGRATARRLSRSRSISPRKYYY